MRATIIALALAGCSSSLGVPRVVDGVPTCFDGDRATTAVAVCSTEIVVEATGSCSSPRAADLSCLGGTYCTRYPEQCADAPFCVLASDEVRGLSGCGEWADACRALGADRCVVEIDGAGNAGAVTAL